MPGTITLTDATKNPVVVNAGATANAFAGLTVADTNPLSSTEVVSIVLSQPDGTIVDPTGGGGSMVNPTTFSESVIVGSTAQTGASAMLSRLQYKAAALTDGQAQTLTALVTVTDSGAKAIEKTPITLQVVTKPSIVGTLPNEPVATGATINPFGPATITDADFGAASDSATITITDGGAATDADGILTGTGLSKTGVGTYTVAATSPQNLTAELHALAFASVAGVAAGQTKNPTFQLAVTDVAANLTSTDSTTSVLIVGPNGGPPNIAGIVSNQTVTPGNFVDPFNSISISDATTGSKDSVTITETDASGKASDTNGTFASQPWLTHTAGTGVYTVAATDSTLLTAELRSLAFTASPIPSGQTSVVTNFEIDASNSNGTAKATSSLTEQVVPPPPVTGNFKVTDETSGQSYFSSGDPYTGPVAGLTNQIILVTSDNLNVVSNIPNVFIKTGSGQDAIDVSGANGNNVLDGSTGSNFLTGGSGDDTFFVDDRTATSDIWSTVKGFHAGDSATVFGVTKQDFALNWMDGQGSAGNTGLTLHATASGKPEASLTLVGYTSADLQNGRLSITFGSEPDGSGNYMLIQGH